MKIPLSDFESNFQRFLMIKDISITPKIVEIRNI